MIGAIRYNLANLGNFKGRDARSTFWFYVLFLVLIYIVVSTVAAIPMMGGAVTTAFEAAQSGASEQELQAKMFAGIAGGMKIAMWVSLVSNLAMVLLLAASFTRRLHDSGHSGLWTVLVIVLKFLSLGLAVETMNRMSEIMAAGGTTSSLDELTRHQTTAAGYGLIGWAGMLILIVFGAWPSSDGTNKYGEEPEAL
jgi:uncharacterized membrane protein YhaH (DUF805 family)